MRRAGCAAILALAALPGAPAAEELDCLIEPRTTVELATPVEGVVDRVLVERGDSVRAGEVVIELQSSVERATVEMAQARAEAQGPLRSARAALQYAEQTLARQEQLNANNVVSAQELDEARSQQELAEAGVREAEEDQRLALLELERARQALGLRFIKSPIDGVVIKREFEAGEYADTRAILELAAIDPLHVEVFAPVGMLGRIVPGMVAEVLPEEPVGGSYPATVKVVDPVIDAASGTFGVRLELPNPDHALPAGLNCRVRFGPRPPPLARMVPVPEPEPEPELELEAERPVAPAWAARFDESDLAAILEPAPLGVCEQPLVCAEETMTAARSSATTPADGTGPQEVLEEAGPVPLELPDVAAAPPAEAPAPVVVEQRSGAVRRAVFTREVVDREPVDSLERVSSEQGRVFFFTELRGLEGETVAHRWEYAGEVRAVVPFAVGGPRWRVYSLMEMAPSWIGEWTVAVVDDAGEVLETAHFEYVAAGADLNGNGEGGVE